jgi:hypothetical protein
MTDIICISPSVFLQSKEIVQVDKKIEELYGNLVSSHPCFTSSTMHYEPQHRVSRTHKTFHTKQAQTGGLHSTDVRKSTISSTDPLRKVKGLLNIVNTSNFDKINRKVQFTINDNNAHNICIMLINTACNQIFFVHIFMKLLNHCIQSTPKILETCADYVHTFFINDTLFDIQEMGSRDFADYQKQKKHIINTSIVVLEMIKNNHTRQYNVQYFVSYMMNKLQHSTSVSEADLLLSALVEIKKRSANLKLDKVKLNNLQECINNNMDSRMHFMVETLSK